MELEPHIWFPIIIILFLCITILPISRSEQPDGYSECYFPFQCGNSAHLRYPFWSAKLRRPSYCGVEGFELDCPEHEYDFPSIRLGSQTFNITWFDPDSYLYHFTIKLKMVRTDVVYQNCSSHLTNTTLSSSMISTEINVRYGFYVKNVTLLYDCPANISGEEGLYNFTCQPSNSRDYFYVYDSQGEAMSLQRCGDRIQVPISSGDTDIPIPVGGNISAMNKYLNQGFHVTVEDPRCTKCWLSKGICGSNSINTSQFICHCQNGDHNEDCEDHSRHVLGIIVTVAGALLLTILPICAPICCVKIIFWMDLHKGNQEMEAFIRDHGPLALTRYKFSDIKKMTKSFRVKLGQGGYGAVYKGELLNGCHVAVKILTASEGNGQDFINEVASISRTSHVNIVNLLGFCLEGKKKALIYEFMPNGSLDKFINTKADETSPSLSWENLYQIALGIARGLEYLHRGCNTRILHFDLKPHNILLDESFCPKISDFGLAKIYPRNESIISLSDARGTIGYLAPEVLNRNIGGVSHKSDVYSYGMILLDIAGGRRNMNNRGSSSSEKYFPEWIYDKLEQGNDLVCDAGEVTMEEHNIVKKITIVGLWCIQTFPTHRPTISKVIDMLEGSLDSLEMPPKPVVSSPTRIDLESFTTSIY